jgi:hypothetical protein
LHWLCGCGFGIFAFDVSGGGEVLLCIRFLVALLARDSFSGDLGAAFGRV